jgi:protein ImuB
VSSAISPNPYSLPPNPCLYACLYSPPVAHQPAESRSTLTDVASDFSPRYERHDDTLVSIDVGGLERLLGPAPTIAEELRRAAAARDLTMHVAVAGTRMAAMVLALARPGVSVVERGREREALASLPLGVLTAVSQKYEVRSQTISNRRSTPGDPIYRTAKPLQSEPVPSNGQTSDFRLQTFTKWGLRTLGELAVLPPADLVARFGRQAQAWQAVARGEDLGPLIPTLPEERFLSTLELEWPIDTLEPLSFVLTRLLEPLSTRLERRDRGVAVLHVLLDLVTRERFARRLELPSPMRDVRTLRTLALLDLEAHPPPAAIDRVTIAVDPTPGRVLQHTLFTRPHPTPEQLSTLVARLGALMGQDRFGAPASVDSYRPGAFEMVPFAADHADRAGKAGGAGRAGGPGKENSASSATIQPIPPILPNVVASALRRCRYPVPARVAVADGRPVRVTTDRRGFAGGTVVRCVGPWRTSGNWWETAGRAGQAGGAGKESSASSASIQPIQPVLPRWDRDEWDVSLNDGGVYHIFQDRDSAQWFIDAVVD